MKKVLVVYLVLLAVLVSVVVIAKAAFEDKGEVKGASFTVGNADIKLLSNLSSGTSNENLVDTKDGPVFSNVYSSWTSDYGVKVYNGGTLKFNLNSESFYETANDPDGLREYIYVEVFKWNDVNNNGIVDSYEIPESSLAKKTILKWKTEGISIGEIDSGETLGLLFRFSVENMSSTKQGKEASYDFVLNATTDGVTQ